MDESLAAIRERIFEKVAGFAGIEVAQVSDTTTLESLGLDSTDAVVLAMEIEQLAGIEIDVAIFLSTEDLGHAAQEISHAIEKAKASGIAAPDLPKPA